MPKNPALSERVLIIEPLMKHFPLGFGFSQYAAVRQVRLGKGAGKIDLVVVTDKPSILLVEAKRRGSPEAKDKVLGQLILYLAHFMLCSTDMVADAIRSATAYGANQRVGFWNGQPRNDTEPTWDEVEGWIRRSTAVQGRASIRALIALDQWVDATDDRRLKVAAELLAKYGLPLSIVLADGRFVIPVSTSTSGG